MPRRVRFLFDYASPYSYLASVLIDRGALPEVAYEPIYLRGLESFAQGMPFTAAKLRYLGKDMERIAAHHQIALQLPTTFPVNGLYALRAALVALRTERFLAFHRRVFEAVWAERREIERADAVVDIAAEVGFDRAELAAKMADPALKDELKRRTADALESGVFGLPAFFVGDELYWGHDRLDYVARAAR